MNTERVLNLAKAVRETKYPEKFSMNSYVHPCGTPACALGNYAAREDLQSEFKLELVKDEFGDFFRIAYADERTSVDFWDSRVRSHFDITDREATLLFGPVDPHPEEGTEERLANVAKTPLEAAEYIERFVAERPF